MSWSINRAAKEAGVSKSTVSRAVRAGKISAARQTDGSFLIEPAELFRVYPRKGAQHGSDPVNDPLRTPHEEAPATSYNEAEMLRIRLELTEQMLARERETVADLRKRLDVEAEKVLALARPPQHASNAPDDPLRTPLHPPVKRGIWDRLRGR